MTRFITTFNTNGIIADDREAADPISAVKAFLASIGEEDEVDEIEPHTIRRTTASGFLVWTVPDSFPEVEDGTVQFLIDTLTETGSVVAAFRQTA